MTNWAQYFLKWVISHPAITCAIPATNNPAHQAENIGALRGPLPDKEMRTRMLRHMETLPGFDKVARDAPLPGQGLQRHHPPRAEPAGSGGEVKGNRGRVREPGPGLAPRARRYFFSLAMPSMAITCFS